MRKCKYKFLRTSSLFSVLFLLYSLSLIKAQDSTDFRKFMIKDDAALNSMIVASIGNLQITAQEFITSYEFGPAFVKREKNSLRRYLDFMIYEKLLACEGYSKGVDSMPDVEMILSDIEGDLATEQLYRNNIWDNIQVSEQEIDRAITKQQVSFQLRWIYKPDYEAIKEQYEKIRQGMSFDSLFNGQFSDEVKREDRYLETNRFKLEKDNPALAAIIDTLKIREVTPPIKTPDGYYLLRIDNMSKNMITSESEMNRLKYDMQKALVKARADSLSDKYVHGLMMKENPVIIRETLNILKAYLGHKILSPEKLKDWDLEKNIRPLYPDFNATGIDTYLNKVLVELKTGNIALAEFIKWYTTREPYIRFEKTSHQAFFLSLQQTIWRMVRDKLLTRLAFEENLQNDEQVKREKKWWLDKLVYSRMKLDIAGSIKTDENKVRQYYETNRKRYVDKDGNIRSFEEAEADVRNDLYTYEYTKRVVNMVLGLKERIPVKINEGVLKRLPIEDKEDSRTIDVYSVKKGGTFMRQAYPTIDYEWQFWN